MCRNVLIIGLAVLACSGSAQIVRQESTNELKKAVYIVDLAGCPQLMKQIIYDGEYSGCKCWAVIAIPELTFSNHPAVEFLIPKVADSSEPDGWIHSDDPDDLFIINDRVVYVFWKRSNYWDGQEYWNVELLQLKIIVIYESQSQPEQSLKVLNTGTGKSLALEWSTNAPNAKVEGYKVYRRSVTE